MDEMKTSPVVEFDIKDGIENCDKKHHGFAKFRHSRVCETLAFLVLLVLNTADLASDWLLYKSVNDSKPGLVYGPPDEGLIIGLLVFSIIGTFTFIFEVANLGKEIYTEEPWINVDLAQVITIWIEDVPQILLNVLIVACREEAISVFQLVKASVILIGIVVRIIISLVRYCNKKSLAELHIHTKESCRHVTYRAFIMIGLIGLAAGSIFIFICTQTTRDENGDITFSVPDSLFEGKYNDERYFNNVSMFFHHPSLDKKGSSNNQANWIRMVTLDDVMNNNGNEDAIFKYEFNENVDKITFSQSDQTGIIHAGECYHVSTSRTLTVAACTPSFIPQSEKGTAFIIKFHYIGKSTSLLFGDISFEMKVKKNDTCHDVDSYIGSSIEDEQTHAGSIGAIHYYRTRNVSNRYHTLQKSATEHEFYHIDNHLTDITQVWKTGFSHCESTGSIAPHRDTNLDVSCV